MKEDFKIGFFLSKGEVKLTLKVRLQRVRLSWIITFKIYDTRRRNEDATCCKQILTINKKKRLMSLEKRRKASNQIPLEWDQE